MFIHVRTAKFISKIFFSLKFNLYLFPENIYYYITPSVDLANSKNITADYEFTNSVDSIVLGERDIP